jgi:hypothetical protein
MRINLIILISLVFYSYSVKAEEPCEGDDCQALKIETIDLQHTDEQAGASLDTKTKEYEHKLKLKEKVISKEETKFPTFVDSNNNIKAKTLAEKEQRIKSNEFKKISNGPLPLGRKTKQ